MPRARIHPLEGWPGFPTILLLAIALAVSIVLRTHLWIVVPTWLLGAGIVSMTIMRLQERLRPPWHRYYFSMNSRYAKLSALVRRRARRSGNPYDPHQVIRRMVFTLYIGISEADVEQYLEEVNRQRGSDPAMHTVLDTVEASVRSSLHLIQSLDRVKAFFQCQTEGASLRWLIYDVIGRELGEFESTQYLANEALGYAFLERRYDWAGECVREL